VPRRAFRLAYDGRPFHGFQRQPDVPTVEDRLLDACEALGLVDADEGATGTGCDGDDAAANDDADGGADGRDEGGRRTPPGYAAAGRTDAGVSALAQTVAFDVPDWCTPRALNAELPDAVRAWASADAPADFHATRDATRRRYRYFLHAPRADVDDGRARAAADALSGEHDLHNLTADRTGTVRTLSVAAARDGPFLVLDVAAAGFPRGLVRRLAALVRAVASGDAPPGKLDRVLAPEPLEGPEGVPAAPPTPLVLLDVTYPDLEFDLDPEAAASARAAFDERAVAGLVAARVAGTVRDGVGSSR
jgi:tRNA pseudouridine38-40 synthase